MYDVVIIGAGPAGISASLYACRANLKVLVLYFGESQLEKAHKIDNYYGFANGISGPELYADGIEQAKNLGVEVKEEQVTHIEMLSPSPSTLYSIKTPFSEYQSCSVIIATGNKKLRPNIKGVKEFEGKGVSYCAVCDGFFYRKKDVAVIGDGEYAFEEASYLAHIANSVVILLDGKNPEIIEAKLKDFSEKEKDVAEKIQLRTEKIAEICGQEGGKVSSVRFDSSGESEISVSGVFVALGNAGGADFAKKLGLELEGDSIKTDEKMKTNAPGIFSCGNVTGGLLQVCKAVYEGAAAGLSVVEYVRENRKS